MGFPALGMARNGGISEESREAGPTQTEYIKRACVSGSGIPRSKLGLLCLSIQSLSLSPPLPFISKAVRVRKRNREFPIDAKYILLPLKVCYDSITSKIINM